MVDLAADSGGFWACGSGKSFPSPIQKLNSNARLDEHFRSQPALSRMAQVEVQWAHVWSLGLSLSFDMLFHPMGLYHGTVEWFPAESIRNLSQLEDDWTIPDTEQGNWLLQKSSFHLLWQTIPPDTSRFECMVFGSIIQFTVWELVALMYHLSKD